MNIIKNLADFFFKNEKNAPKKQSQILDFSPLQIQEFKKRLSARAYDGTPVNILRKPAFDCKEFIKFINNLLTTCGIPKELSSQDVQAFDIFTPESAYIQSCLAVHCSHGYIYVCIGKKQILFSENNKHLFKPANFFRIYFPFSGSYHRLFASCSYQNGFIVAHTLYKEYNNDDEPEFLIRTPLQTPIRLIPELFS